VILLEFFVKAREVYAKKGITRRLWDTISFSGDEMRKKPCRN